MTIEEMILFCGVGIGVCISFIVLFLYRIVKNSIPDEIETSEICKVCGENLVYDLHGKIYVCNVCDTNQELNE